MATTKLRKLDALKRCKRMVAEDRISDMPDEILCHILTRLTLKEAIATGVLSERWKNLWASCPNLNFGCLKLLKMGERTYVRCIDNILRQYNAQNLHKFRIVRPSDISGQYLDEWISFAINHGVCELDLNLNVSFIPGYSNNYYFPAHFFASPNVFESLTDLCLRTVNLTDDVFNLILSSCFSLERFILEFSYGLVNAINTAPHPNLKSLELYCCHHLQYLQVFAPNLISFKYDGNITTLSIKDAKQLASLRLSIFPVYKSTVILPRAKNFVFTQFSSHFANLKSLVISAHLFKDMSDFTELCVFSNLKRLEVDVKFTWVTYLAYSVVASIIRGAPLLELLEIVLPPFIPTWQEYPALELASMSPHQNLKEVKLFGFRGDKKTMEFLSYLSKNTVSLQKINITARFAIRHGEDLTVDNTLHWKIDAAEHAKNCVVQLRQTMHGNTQLLFHDG
ncbi:F-box/LRR-repeat protein At3g59210-like [Chenopodium quinoa]|uniref:F-box domain-containing protein n=1 Tax=Chenopodium quinoa TaxID=63459 RepID=A0A803LGI2_CHEQI|nr:F-box/LRR-repeat protein At3g59210-like [Chenopodium quinoa]